MTIKRSTPVSIETSRISPSWAGVAGASVFLLATFFITEYDLGAIAHSIASQDEDAILDKSTDGAEKGNLPRAMALLLFAGVGGTLLVFNKRMPWNPHRVGLALVFLLVVWSAMTVTWAAVPSLSLRRLIAWLCFVIGCIGLARTLTPREVARVALVTLTAMISVSMLSELAAGAGPWQSGYRFSGGLHPNVQATYCAALCIAAFALSFEFRSPTVCRVALAGGMVMIFLTGSRTSLFATLLAIGAAWLLRQGGAVRGLAVGLLTSVIGAALCAFFLLSPSDQNGLTGAALLGRTEKAGSLSGRVPLWEELMGYAVDRPIGGYGYDSFWTPGVMEDIYESQHWSMTSAHNIYLETVLQLGLVGLVLGVAATLLVLWLTKQRYDATGDPAFLFVFGLLVYAMLNGLLEAHFLRPKYPTALALMGVATVMLYRPTEQQPTVGSTKPIAIHEGGLR